MSILLIVTLLNVIVLVDLSHSKSEGLAVEDLQKKLLFYQIDASSNATSLLEESTPEKYNLTISNDQKASKDFQDIMAVKCKNDFSASPCGAFSLVGCTGYKRFYAESTVKLSWLESWELCRDHGMILASIDSRYEQNILETYLIEKDEASLKPYWTSGTDLGRRGSYFWLATGKSFSSTFDYFLRDRVSVESVETRSDQIILCVQLVISSDFTKSDYWEVNNCTDAAAFTLCQLEDM